VGVAYPGMGANLGSVSGPQGSIMPAPSVENARVREISIANNGTGVTTTSITVEADKVLT
jgi:hypothetical protein